MRSWIVWFMLLNGTDIANNGAGLLLSTRRPTGGLCGPYLQEMLVAEREVLDDSLTSKRLVAPVTDFILGAFGQPFGPPESEVSCLRSYTHYRARFQQLQMRNGMDAVSRAHRS